MILRTAIRVVLIVCIIGGLVVAILATRSHFKILVDRISLGGTGDNYAVSPAKVEVANLGRVVKIPISIENNNDEAGIFKLEVIAPTDVGVSYVAYPVNGLWTTFDYDIVEIAAHSKGTVNLYVGRVMEIPSVQLWVHVSIETNEQITSAYIVNVLIKGGSK